MLESAQIDAIVEQVMSELGQGERVRHGPTPAPVTTLLPPEPARSLQHGDNLFPNVDRAVAAAQGAFEALQALPLEVRESMISQIRRLARENAQVLAYEAWKETGMGRYEDKIQKNLLNANKTPGTEILTPTSWSGDRGLTLTEWAPFGVIGAITPSTNPTSTLICNTIAMVAAGNAVVFNAHPGSKGASNHTAQIMNEAIVEGGGPPNLVCAIAEPTIETATDLMHHKGVRILTVTGGIGVVRAAMSSGKRAIAAGPGNPPVLVDETADLEQAGRDVVFGASFDNNIICTDEKTTIVVDTVADRLVQAMVANGAYRLKEHELKRLERVIFKEMGPPNKPGVINQALIGKNAAAILSEIGITVDGDLRLVVAEVRSEHSLVWTEQMMPVMPVVRVHNVDDAIDLAVRSEHGFRHTASIHSTNVDTITRMARAMNCSIFVANGPNFSGLGEGGEGFTSFSIASPTGEGMTRPRHFSRVRRISVVGALRIV